MKILVVSGFLGAGKTTFIECLTKKLERNFVILENEYGEVGIDGDLLKKDYDKIWEMTEGCICCSMKSNFANSVMTIANSLDPEVLIVEPTGVGKLSAVMENIKKVQYERIQILEPITIVDPSCIDSYTEEFGEIFNDQIKNSKFVVISKTANMSKGEINEAENKIRKINGSANIFSNDYDDFDDNWWADLLEVSWIERSDLSSDGSGNSSIDNIGFKNVCFEDLQTFTAYMSAIMSKRFGNVVRAKGFLPINGVWSKMDIVGNNYTLVQIEPMYESKLIFIGSDLKKDELEILFKDKKQKRKRMVKKERSIFDK